jgi:hypothetical protein
MRTTELKFEGAIEAWLLEHGGYLAERGRLTSTVSGA